MPDIKGLTSGYLLLAAYILPEQQTNLRINPDDAENLLIMFKMFDKPTKSAFKVAESVGLQYMCYISINKKYENRFLCYI